MKRVLVVDDMPIIREPVAAALRHAGYEAICASDGVEAMSSIKGCRPDLILLDLAMPNMDGLTFLRALRGDAATASLPVILLTAITDRDSIVGAARLGVRDYLLKSRFSLKNLIDRIRSYIRDVDDAAQAIVGVLQSAIAPEPGQEAGDPAATAIPESAKQLGETCADSAESLKTLKPLITRSQMAELLDDCGELKALSPSVMQIIKLTSSNAGSVENVVDAVKADQAIALKVLKLANSVVYTRGEPVENVHKAVMRIGLSQIRQAVLNIAVVEQFGSNTHNEHLDSLQFWEHSIATGLICSRLARAIGLEDAEVDSAFTMGLLHDVGRLVYSDLLGEKYHQVMATARSLQLPLEQVESRLLLVNHADAMDRILHTWRFPKSLINPIAFHHLSMGNIRHMARSTVQEVSLLGLADRLAHAMLLGDSGNPTIYPTEEFCQVLRLDGAVVAEIQQNIVSETQDMKLAMLSRGTAPSGVSAKGPRLPEGAAPLFMSASPATDAYRIAVERLAGSLTSSEPHNVAVVHLTTARECAPVTSRLQAAEAQLDLKPLPAVVISPSGDLGLSESPAARRRVVKIASPTNVERFLAAIHAARLA